MDMVYEAWLGMFYPRNTNKSDKSSSKIFSRIHAGLIFLAFIVFLVMVTLNALAAYNPTGLFASPGILNLTERYATDITPVAFTFTIWAIIYSWQAIWLLYAIVSIFRDGDEGPLFRSPILLPPLFFIIFTAANLFNIAWLFVFDTEMLVGSFVILILIVISLYVCIAISMRYLAKNVGVLETTGLGAEKWWIRIGVQSGVALYATWATIVALLTLAIVLQYVSDVPRASASTVALILILVFFLFWFFLELGLLDKYTRYLIVPYITLIWAFSGILIHQRRQPDWSPSNGNVVITATGMTIAIVMVMVKFVVMIYRSLLKSQQ